MSINAHAIRARQEEGATHANPVCLSAKIQIPYINALATYWCKLQLRGERRREFVTLLEFAVHYVFICLFDHHGYIYNILHGHVYINSGTTHPSINLSKTSLA
mmetsp:Transcript_7225/g.20484  ORF Transcript_7225/g.20484 Transcript_7225/m.20484 type:complete len:103 (+) Transcript_7225:204-512(+)